MTVLDAYAVVAFLAGERAASEVDALLRDRVDLPLVTAVNLAEVVDVLVRRYGQPATVVGERVDWLIAGGLDVVQADEVMGRAAGTIRAERYHRSSAPISLGDAFALAAAVLLERRLATADPTLASVAVLEGVEIVALPDSAGRRP